MEKFATAGEMLAQQELRKEKRGGVDHYAEGQEGVRVTREGTTWVGEAWHIDQMGHVVLVLCAWHEGSWVPVTGMRAGQTSASDLPFPPCFTLSVKSQEKLAAAREGAESNGL